MTALSAPPTGATRPTEPVLKVAFRFLLAAFMIFVGITHFTTTSMYMGMMPPYLPAHLLLIQVSGVAEIAGGIGLLIPALRRAAGWGLMALYVAVLPANIHLALYNLPLNGLQPPAWVSWLRVLFQGVFFAWAWWVALARPRGQPPAS